MRNKFLTKILGATLGLAMAVGVGVGVAANNRAATKLDATTSTYQHIFNAKPSTGSNVTLSGIAWEIEATRLGNYNSGNYAGVQIGSSGNDGALHLTSANAWGAQTSTTYYGKTVISEIRLWLNHGGGSINATVTIGGTAADDDGTAVVKNSSAGSDYTKATCVTYTPATNHNTGIVDIQIDSSSKAGYVCCLEIDCDEPAADTPAVTVSPTSLFLRTGESGQAVAASATHFSGTVSYAWTHLSGTDCVDLTNANTANVTMTPKNNISEYASGVYRVTASYSTESATADVTVVVDNGGSVHPYTIAEARAAIDRGVGLTDAFVKGVIYQIDSYSQQYHSLTYWISDNGSSSVPFEVYSGLNVGGANFSGLSDLSVGDIVVVTGELKKQSSTYELNYNNELVSRISVASIAVKTAPDDVEYGEGERFNPTGLVVTATYDDTPDPTTKDFAYDDLTTAFIFNPTTSTALSNETSVSITLFGKTTTQAITVVARTITGVTVTGDMTNKAYVKGSAWDYRGLSLTVAYNFGEPTVVLLKDLTVGADFTVSNATADGTTSLTIAGTYNGNAITSRTITGISYTTSVEFVAGTDIGTSGESAFVKKSGVLVSTTSGDLSRNDNYRPYSGQTFTINCPSRIITKVEFACSSAGYNTLTGTGYTKDGSDGVWIGYSNSVDLTASGGQSRITSLTVTLLSDADSVAVDELTTKTSLYYQYHKDDGGNFTYSNVAIRFGALMSKDLWDNLDTASGNIQGYGVLVSTDDFVGGNQLQSYYYTADNINVFKYSKTKAQKATPTLATDAQKGELVGDHYIWNVFFNIPSNALTDTYVAVAYVKIGGDILFMNEVRISAAKIAYDLINGGTDAGSAEGSLQNLANQYSA